jgi:amino acid transporter
VTTRERSGLAHRTLGLREVLFQSLAAMAPGGALAVSIAVAATFAGGALPVAVIAGFLPCITVAMAIGQLSKHLASAGSIYTYPARALHPNLGFLVGWGYALAAASWCPAVALMTSFQIAGLMTHGQGAEFTLVWTISFCVTCLVIVLLGYRGIGLSARTGTALGTIEIAIFVALSTSMIVAAGQVNTAAPFSLTLANVNGYQGVSGIIVAAVFTVQAFVGFEAAAPLAEEAVEPKRTIMRATLFACIGVGLFYVLATYAAVVFRGPGDFSTFGASLDQGNPWIGLAQRVWGAGWTVVFLAVLSSNFGAQNAFSNAASRTWYAMARIRLLPRALERTHPRWRSPHIAVFAQFVFTLLAGGAVGLLFGPVDGSVLLATMCTAIPLAVYILINISCMAYYWRYKRDEFNWLLHGVIPIAGAVLLVPILMAALGVGGSLLRFIAPLPHPISLSGPVLLAWYSAGLVYLMYLRRRFPERLQRTGEIFGE